MTADQEPNPFRPPEPDAPRAPAAPWPAPGGPGAPPAWPAAPASGFGAAAPVTAPAAGGYPGWGAVPAAGPRNGMGTASMVLGVIGACLCWTLVLSPVAFVVALIGFILGLVALGRVRRGEATNRVYALSGTVTGAAGGAVALTLSVCLVILSARPAAVQSHAGAEYLAGAGELVRYEDGLRVVIGEPERMAADGTGDATVALTVDLTHHGEESTTLTGGEITAYADEERLPASGVRVAGQGPPDRLRPGETVTLTYAVTVPEDAERLGLDYAPSGGHTVAYWEFGLPEGSAPPAGPDPGGEGGGSGGSSGGIDA